MHVVRGTCFDALHSLPPRALVERHLVPRCAVERAVYRRAIQRRTAVGAMRFVSRRASRSTGTRRPIQVSAFVRASGHITRLRTDRHAIVNGAGDAFFRSSQRAERARRVLAAWRAACNARGHTTLRVEVAMRKLAVPS
ncbi:MAG TPA: hypothetical protein VIL35_01040, partial [Vicinamibacterales bacterium]